MIPLPPETLILENAKAIVQGLPLAATFGLPGDVFVRHFRHREARKSERPGVALRYVGTEMDNERQQFHTSSEVCRALNFDIVVDIELLPESTDLSTPSGDGNDATGWDRLLGVGHFVAGKLVAMNSPMRLIVDDLLYRDVDPDEDTQPDNGRLAAGVIVLYRTLFDDPMHLLGPEQNG